MSVMGDVFDSLRAMNQWQLLLAFIACTAYALAQGDLAGTKLRRYAWGIALASAICFALESAQWTYAAMLTSFAIAGLGLFVALAWLLSRLLGFSKPRATAEAIAFAESVEASELGESEFATTIAQAMPALAPPSTQSMGLTLSQHGDPAHSI